MGRANICKGKKENLPVPRYLFFPCSRAMRFELPLYSTLHSNPARLLLFLKSSPGDTGNPQLTTPFSSPAFPGDSCDSTCSSRLALLPWRRPRPATQRSTARVQQGGNLLPPGIGAAHPRPSCSGLLAGEHLQRQARCRQGLYHRAASVLPAQCNAD